MRYALNYCTATENAEAGTVTFTGPCVVSGVPITVTVPKSGLDLYKSGAYIQNAFPALSAGDREFLISGICEKEFDAMFGEDPADGEF